MTFEPSQQIDLFGTVTDFQTSSSAARRAKTSAAPTPKEKASKGRAAGSTSMPSVSLENAALVGSLLKTALISELGALTPSSLRWKHSATSELTTSGPEAGSSDATPIKLPTPIAGNSGGNKGGGAGRVGPYRPTTKTMIRQSMLTTPMASDGMKDGAGGGAGSTYPFRMILAETLPTPTKRDKRMDAWSPAYDKRKSPTMDAVLDGAMRDRASDKWQYAREIAATLQNGGLTGQSMSLPVTYNWMMGFPPGWLSRALRSALQKGLLQPVSSSKRSAMPLSRKSPKQ
jgi:hypothetical protein